jgi:hypothetical protein
MTNIGQNVRSALNYITQLSNFTILCKDLKIGVSTLEKVLSAVAHVFEKEIFASKLPSLAKYVPRIKVLAGNIGDYIKKHSNFLQVLGLVSSVTATYFAFKDLRKHENLKRESEANLDLNLLQDIRNRCQVLSDNKNKLNELDALATSPNDRVMLETNKKYFALEASMSEVEERLHNSVDDDVYALRKRHIRQIFLEEEEIAEAQMARRNNLIDTAGNVTAVAMIAIDSFLPLPGLKCGATLISKALALKDLSFAASFPVVNLIAKNKTAGKPFAELAKKVPELFFAAAAA